MADPSISEASHSHSLSLSSGIEERTGREIEREECGDNVGGDKYIIICEEKRGETTASDAKTFSLHLPQAGWCPLSLQAGLL